jgi:hypothetical protein
MEQEIAHQALQDASPACRIAHCSLTACSWSGRLTATLGIQLPSCSSMSIISRRSHRSLGHGLPGDEGFEIVVAERIARAIRPGDTVARSAGTSSPSSA